MSLLEITGLTHTFGENTLYRDADLTIHKKEHVGIVGKNGSGKSTLIKICTEQIVPDKGRVVWEQKLRIGYLDQYAEIDKRLTLHEFLKSAFAHLYELEKKMNDIYENIAGDDEKALNQAFKYQEELEGNNFYSIDTRIAQVVTGLGLDAIGIDRAIEEMSGGQRAKVILAKLLLQNPDVLLLDEPTNFLDKEHITWLGEYLNNFENSFLVVSHDFGFLDTIANRIVDIDNYKTVKYYGTYSEFLRKKTLLREDYVRQYAAQQKEIKKTEEFIRKNIAGRKSKMARGRQKQLDRMERMEALPQKEKKPFFSFKGVSYTETEHLSVKQLSIGYSYPLLRNINFSVKGGQKVVITGFNGIGKSTLLKTLVGQIPVIDGKYHFSDQVVLGYFEQDLMWEDASQTPIQIVSDHDASLTNKEIRKRLAACGITSKQAMNPVNSLSGGEQTKVKMCIMMLKSYNFIILDEPTNHLDVLAKEALKSAICDFQGTVILVSHEEDFYRDWADKIIDIEKSVR